jgi:hypothetical protein
MDDVRERLDDAGRNEPDAGLRDQLHGDGGGGVRLFQVEDELRQVLDRVDVVVRGRRDQRDARLCVAQARDLGRDLLARELAALAGLRPLRDLDLELIRVREVLGRDAEPRRRDLLDPRVALGPETSGILAALTGVRARAEAVEGDRDGLVGFRGERPMRHRAAREAPDDRRGRLDLCQRRRLAVRRQLEQVAQLERLPLVHERGEAVVVPAAQRVRRLLQRLDDRRARRVRLAALPKLDVARVLELRRVLPRQELALELREADAADRRGRPREARLDDVVGEPDRLEQARTAV